MPFDAKQFCLDYDIQWYPPGFKNVGKDFIGIKCPMCPDPSSHGGFHIKKSYYSCHRCGGHWMLKIVSILAKVSIDQAKKIIKKYSSDKAQSPESKIYKYIEKVIFPPDTGPLTERARQYLIGRNFDPDYLVHEWGILSTGNIGDYKFSILAPIYLNEKLISYQCRDITGNWTIPYKGCPIEESVLHLKYTLYGFDKAIKNKKCIVVEGLMDNWRLGPGAVATLGIGFTMPQARMLAKYFDDIFIMYDPEEEAQEKADKLFWILRGFNKNVEILECPAPDPGELTDQEAREIIKELGL